MAYGESNVTCPMTSRDARWSGLSHIFVINSRNKGYNHSRRFAPYYRPSVLQPPCKYNWKFEKWDYVSEMSRVCNLGYVSVTMIV